MASNYVPGRFKKKKRKATEPSESDSSSDEFVPTPKKRPAKKKKASPKKVTRKKKGIRKKLVVTKQEVLASINQVYEEEKRKLAGKKAISLDDLNLGCFTKQVEELKEDGVRREIELIMNAIVKTIMAGNGLAYSIPSRSSSNQMYVPELDRIVLKNSKSLREFANPRNARKAAITTRLLQIIYEVCVKKIHVTKRDLFYTDVKLFVDQRDSDNVLDDVACMVGCTRTSLNVIASPKGVVVGCLQYTESGDFIDCERMGKSGKAIPAFMDSITSIKSKAKFILLVEKDAAFQRLAEDRFYKDYPCILITAKGQPDVATRLFLKKVKTTLNIPVLGLVDSDPYGLKILSVYMSGSKNMSYDSASLTTADIKWLGVRPSDLDRLNVPEQCRLKMTEQDIKTGLDLLKEDFIIQNPEWVKELEWMIEHKVKAEIQALSSFDFQYLTKEYLPKKLALQDWI